MRHLIGGSTGPGGAGRSLRIPRWRGAAALGALVAVAAVAPATAAPSIAQRVLRPADVPGSALVTPPPRAMTLAVFVRQTASALTAGAQARAKATLRAAGFRVGSHVSLSGPGARGTASSAIQLGSAAKAADVVAYQLRWVGSLSADTSEQVTPLPSLPQGKLVRIVSRNTTQRGWAVVFARGAGVYTVAVVEGKGNVSKDEVIALARKLLARAGGR
jgi:hypothetical protein